MDGTGHQTHMPSPLGPLREPQCPICGGPNGCVPAAAGSFEVNCWCKQATFNADLVARVPLDLQRKACICRRCAEGAPAGNAEQQALTLKDAI